MSLRVGDSGWLLSSAGCCVASSAAAGDSAAGTSLLDAADLALLGRYVLVGALRGTIFVPRFGVSGTNVNESSLCAAA